VLDAVTNSLGAPVAVISLVDGDALRAAWSRGLSDDYIAAIDGLRIDAMWPAGDVAETASPLFVERHSDLEAAYPQLSALPARTGLHGALAYVPMLVDDQVLGILGVRFDQDREFSEAERGYLRSLAHQAGLAFERARAFAAEEAARHEAEEAVERQRRLVEATRGLVASVEPDEVALVVVGEVATALGADAALLVCVDGEELEVRGVHSWPSDDVAVGLRFGPTAGGVARASTEAVSERFVGSPEDVAAVARPDAKDRPAEPAGTEQLEAAWLVPLRHDDRVLGGLVLGFVRPHVIADAEVDLVRTLAGQSAQALDRATLRRRERDATVRAEFLARSAEVLSRSLDYRATLGEVAALAVPALADWCFVNVIDDAGRIVAVTSAHADPAKGWLADLAPRYAPGRDEGASTTYVLRTGHPVLVPDVPDEQLQRDARDEEHLAFLRAFAARSAIVVPLTSHDRTFGSITFLTAESDRRYSNEDLAVAEELSRRAAAAIENARLYEDLARSRERAEFLSRASAVLAQSLDRQTLLRRLAEITVPAIADWCFVNWPDATGTLRNAVAVHADPSRADVAAEALGRPIDDPAYTEGRSIVWPSLSDDVLDEVSNGDPQRLALYRSLGVASAVAVPIPGRTGPLGSLSILASADRPAYRPEDVTLAQDLAYRTALAVENAELYENVRHFAGQERERAGELEAVLHAIGEPVVVCDAFGVIRLANDAALTLFGGELPLTYAELLGRLDPAGDPPRLGVQTTQGPIECALRGTDRWVELTAYPVRSTVAATGDGGKPERETSTILVLRDVTQSRQAQKLREAFIGVLSHELRTPITTIYGGTRVLARPSVPEQTRRDVSADVIAEAERLHRLVEDLLVLARAERDSIDIEGDPVLLQHVLPRVLRSETARWPEVRIESHVPPAMPTIAGDETYVEQLVRNLVGNAAKYGGPGSTVEIVAEPSETEVVVRVLDNGPGFAADETSRLFDLFYRSPEAQAKSGAGIGLFVCRALAVAMGGRIWAKPRETGGAEFGFALPVYAEDRV
jgi:GAF domain-containing protein